MALLDNDLLKQILGKLDPLAGNIESFRLQVERIEVGQEQTKLYCARLEKSVEELLEYKANHQMSIAMLQRDTKEIMEREKGRQERQEKLEEKQRDAKRVSLAQWVSWLITLLLAGAAYLKR